MAPTSTAPGCHQRPTLHAAGRTTPRPAAGADDQRSAGRRRPRVPIRPLRRAPGPRPGRPRPPTSRRPPRVTPPTRPAAPGSRRSRRSRRRRAPGRPAAGSDTASADRADHPLPARSDTSPAAPDRPAPPTGSASAARRADCPYPRGQRLDRVRPVPGGRHARRPGHGGRRLPRVAQAGVEADDRFRPRERGQALLGADHALLARGTARHALRRGRELSAPPDRAVPLRGARARRARRRSGAVLLRPDRGAEPGARIG